MAEGKKNQVEIWTERYRIIGTIHTPAGVGHTWRFSDILNKQDRSFIPLTDVTIFPLSGEDVLWRGDFMALNREFIVLAKE